MPHEAKLRGNLFDYKMINKLKINKIIISINLFLNFIFVKTALAVGNPAEERLNTLAGNANFETEAGLPLATVITNVIIYALGFLGVFFLVLILVAGFQWMTAEGNEEQLTKAKSRLKNAVIGFVVVLLAYSITTAVINIYGQSL